MNIFTPTLGDLSSSGTASEKIEDIAPKEDICEKSDIKMSNYKPCMEKYNDIKIQVKKFH